MRERNSSVSTHHNFCGEPLDNRWTIFRNLQLSGHKGDIDIVLVGPAGVWAVEVKAYGSPTRVQKGKWEIQTKKGWVRLHDNPSSQVTHNAKRLNLFLQEHGITRWVERAIVLDGPHPISYFRTSEIPVWLLPSLEGPITTLSTRTAPTAEEIKQIVTTLKETAMKQAAKDEAKGHSQS